MVVCLSYNTRLEFSYYVDILTQFIQTPIQDHCNATIRVLSYLKPSPGQGIVLPKYNNLKLVNFFYSNWASCPLTRKSISSYLKKLGNAPISWKTKKKVNISQSSSEAEYHVMTHATSELIWLRSLLSSLQVAIHLAVNPVFHERIKHIKIDYHFVIDHIQSGTSTTTHLSTHQQ